MASGFIVDQSGYIITNVHAVIDKTEVMVKLYDGKTFVAKVFAIDDLSDLALLKVTFQMKGTVNQSHYISYIMRHFMDTELITAN